MIGPEDQKMQFAQRRKDGTLQNWHWQRREEPSRVCWRFEAVDKLQEELTVNMGSHGPIAGPDEDLGEQLRRELPGHLRDSEPSENDQHRGLPSIA